MVRASKETVSDDAVRAATGHGREHWFRLLDGAGASSWNHTAIARHLTESGLDAWWAQGVTVAYEQARGLRLPGQQPDGTFSASASVTLRVPLSEVWPHLVGSLGWLDGGWSVSGITEGKSVRYEDGDGHRAVVNFYGSSGDVTKVAVQVSKLRSAEDVAAMKEQWKGSLAALRGLVS